MKKRTLITVMIVVIMSLAIGCNNTSNNVIPAEVITMEAKELKTRDYLKALSVQIGSRVAGTADEKRAFEYCVEQFSNMGYTVKGDGFTYEVDGAVYSSQNAEIIKKGNSGKQIIIGAHYDSVKRGTGADDNASGVAVVLEVAKQMKEVETPYTLVFVLFGAEEDGLQGSTHYVSQMTPEDIENTLVMVNLDSLIAGDFAYVYGNDGDDGIYRDWLLEKAHELNLDLITQVKNEVDLPPGTTGDWSDHVPFKSKGIPYVYFESTNWNLGAQDGYTQVDMEYGVNGEIWHTDHDTVEYIDSQFPNRVDERLGTFTHVLSTFLENQF